MSDTISQGKPGVRRMVQIPEAWDEDFLLYLLPKRWNTLQEPVSNVNKKYLFLLSISACCLPDGKVFQFGVLNWRESGEPGVVGSLTCSLSSQALWWMTLIFLSSSHYYFNVYLEAFIYPVQTGLDREERKRGGREEKGKRHHRERAAFNWTNCFRSRKNQYDCHFCAEMHE